ncbi:MAG TPA: lipopolysaccharide assembly protein LapA domain-containing protein [Gaiellaceae bacterium]|nr:lipopolysaccharide assembly protein LapA domain-containing protein [Gaiellaceae bacterium]
MSTPEPPDAPAEPPAVSQEATPAPVTKPEVAAHEDRPSTWQPMLYLRIALLLFAIAYSIAFVAENRREIDVDFVFGTARVRLIWEILLLLGIGLVAGVLLSQLYRNRRRAQRRR